MTRELLWYYTEMGVPQGPVTWNQLKNLTTSQIIGRTEVVRREDQTDWVTMADAYQHQFHRPISAAGLAMLAEEDPMADYDRPVGKDALQLWTMIVIFVFIFIPISVDHHLEASSSPDQWPNPTVFLAGLGLLLLPLLWIAYQRSMDWRVGSSWDSANRTLTWWNGPATAKRHVVRIDDISSIRVEDGEEVISVALFGRHGEEIAFDSDSLRDARAWTEALVSRYPHIAVEAPIPTTGRAGSFRVPI